MITHSEMKNVYELSCKCTNLTNVGGYVNCNRNDENELEICYVVRPSACPDLMDSFYFRFLQYLEEACKMKDGTENIGERHY